MVGASSRHQLQHVAAETMCVGGRMARLEDAAIDAAPQMLDEGTEQAPIGGANDVVGAKLDGDRYTSDSPQTESTALFSSCEYGCCGLSSTARAAPASTTLPLRMIMMRSLIV